MGKSSKSSRSRTEARNANTPKSSKAAPMKTKKPEKPPAYALVFYLKYKSTGVIENFEPTLIEGKTCMAPLPIHPETREPAEGEVKLRAKVLKLGHDPEYLYGCEPDLTGKMKPDKTNDEDLENRDPKISVDKLRTDTLHELELTAKKMQPIFGKESSPSTSTQLNEDPDNLEQSTISMPTGGNNTPGSGGKPSMSPNQNFVDGTAHSTPLFTRTVSTSAEQLIVAPESAQILPESGEKPSRSQTQNCLDSNNSSSTSVSTKSASNDTSSSHLNKSVGQMNTVVNNEDYVAGDALWPCQREDPTKMRLVTNVDIFAKRCFVNGLPKVVPLTPECKKKKVPPKEVFGTALFPRGMCNNLLKELVPPELAKGLKIEDLPSNLLMVIKIVVNSTLDRTMKITDSEFTEWVADFGRNFKRDRKSELYSVLGKRKAKQVTES